MTWRVLLAGLAAVPPLAAGQPGASPRADGVFVLGDSLSDIGNAAALADFALGEPFHPEHTVGLCNPADVYLVPRDCDPLIHRRSRVSDGPVAVERLTSELGLPPLVPSYHIVPERPAVGTNYAVAGAKAAGPGVADFAIQVEFLIEDHGPRLPAGALYVVVIGGNDALDSLKLVAHTPNASGLPEEAERQVLAAVAAIAGGVERLVEAGARELLVANLPRLSVFPAVRERAREAGLAEAGTIDAAELLARRFNEALTARVAELRAAHPDARPTVFDLHASLESARAEARRAGRNVTDACFDSERYRDSLRAERRFHPGCAPRSEDEGPRFEHFFFWDALHPTGRVHAEAGEALAAAAAERRAAPSAEPYGGARAGRRRSAR